MLSSQIDHLACHSDSPELIPVVCPSGTDIHLSPFTICQALCQVHKPLRGVSRLPCRRETHSLEEVAGAAGIRVGIIYHSITSKIEHVRLREAVE